jgi:hypothetical protein
MGNGRIMKTVTPIVGDFSAEMSKVLAITATLGRHVSRKYSVPPLTIHSIIYDFILEKSTLCSPLLTEVNASGSFTSAPLLSDHAILCFFSLPKLCIH